MPRERPRPEEKMQFLFVSGELQVLFGLYLIDPVRFSLAEYEYEYRMPYSGGIVFKQSSIKQFQGANPFRMPAKGTI
jgi:hypothetical protein